MPCRVGKGTHAASERLSSMLRSAEARWGTVYVLKADVTKYFYSIDHDILLRIVARTIGDREVLNLLRVLVKGADCIKGEPWSAAGGADKPVTCQRLSGSARPFHQGYAGSALLCAVYG